MTRPGWAISRRKSAPGPVDPRAREFNKGAREFRQVNRVLLLPYSTESKLLAKWQGPYEEVWRIGPFDYDVLCPDKQEREKESSRQLIESLVGTGSGLDPPRFLRSERWPALGTTPLSEDDLGEIFPSLWGEHR